MQGKYKSIKSYRLDLIPEGNEPPVKEPVEYILNHTEYDDNNNATKEITYHADGSIEQIFEMKYDAQGKLVEEFLYYEDNEIADHKKYERDAQGNIKKELVYYNDETFDTIEYKYDSEMNLIEKTTVNSDGETDEKEIFEYSKGNIILHAEFDSVNKKLSETIYLYNEAGKITELTEWDSETDKKFKTVNQYNDNGILIKQLRYLKDNLIAKLEFEINENNKVYIVLDEDTKHKNTLKINYEEKGNVIEEAEYDRNDELNHSIRRVYNENNDVIESTVFIDHRIEGYQENYRIRYEYSE